MYMLFPTPLAMRRTVAILLPALMMCTAIATAQGTATPKTEAAQNNQDGRLIAVELTVPMCLRHHPEQGKLLEAAWSDWGKTHASELKAYHMRLAAHPKDAAKAREMLRSSVEVAVTGTQGAQVCANAATVVSSLGGSLDMGAAAGMYYSSMLRADALEEACSKLHPSIADDLARDRRKWEADDSAFQRLSRNHMEQKAKEPGSGLPAMWAEGKRAWGTVVEEQEAKGNAETFCRAQFADLAAGKMHEKVPDVYEALNRALKAK